MTGYYLSENPTANPTGATSGWKVQPTTFPLADRRRPAHRLCVGADQDAGLGAGPGVTSSWIRRAHVSGFDVTPTTSIVRSVAVTFTSADAGGAAASGITKYAVVNGTTVPSRTSTAWKVDRPDEQSP